jgi:hypothetical protein
MEMPPHVCFSCQHKNKWQQSLKPHGTSNGIIPPVVENNMKGQVQLKTRKSVKKKHQKLNDKYQDKKKDEQRLWRNLDGALFFPAVGIIIHSDLQHIDSRLSIAKQIGFKKDEVEQGLAHMNFNPSNAFALEQGGSFPAGNAKNIEIHHADCLVSYGCPKDPNITIKRCVEVIVIDSLKAASLTGSQKIKKGCDWITATEMTKAIEYLTAQHVKAAKEREVKLTLLPSLQLPSIPREVVMP